MGGVGHFWVKRLFVTRDFHTNKGENPEDYFFIPATVDDNPHLLKESPDYIQALDLLPEDIRRAHRYGDWDALAGTFFPEVQRKTHVIPDFWKVPEEWVKYRCFDYGLDMFACLWIAVDFDGRAYVYREVNQSGLITSEAAQLMQDMTPPRERIAATIAPPDLWSRQKDSGKTMADIFMEHGVNIIRASNSRVQGWMALKEALKPMKSPEDRPGLLFCESCKNIFDNISMIQHSDKDPNDCSTEPHDITHAPDALRYYAVTRLMKAELPAVDEPPDLGEEQTRDYDSEMTGGDANDSYIAYGG